MRFFDDADMDFATRCVLSGVRHGMAEVGETLTAVEAVRDGDPDSWAEVFIDLGRRVRAVADEAVARGHGHSAWNAALRAANYLYAGTWWTPVTSRADQRLDLWAEHRASWELALSHWPTPVERLTLPHRDTTMPGLWFASPVAPERAAAVVLVGGLGTPISDLCMTGLDGALARGHHVLVVEGPGQGGPLYELGRSVDRSWPELLCTAMATAAGRPEVDPDAVGLLGVGAGALFAAGAAARGAANDDATGPALLVLNPAVLDLGADAAASVEAATDDRSTRLLAWSLTDPTGERDPAAAVVALQAHALTDLELGAIRCPTLVVGADRAFGFRGQEAPLLEALRCPHDHLTLRAADGAGADAGIDASQVQDAAVFDWWDARLTDRTPRTSGVRPTDGGSDG